MQLKCPGFSSLSITTDIRYGSAFQRKWDETPLKKKKKDVGNKSDHPGSSKSKFRVTGSQSKTGTGRTNPDLTNWHQEGRNSKPRSLLLQSVRAVLYATQFRSYRWSLAVRYRLRDLSLYCHGGFFFFFQMPQRQFLTDAHMLFFLSVHLSSTFSNPLELTGVISSPYVCAKLLAAFDKVMRFSGITELERPASNHTLRADGTRRMQDGPWPNLPHDVKAAAAQQNRGGIRSVLSKSL